MPSNLKMLRRKQRLSIANLAVLSKSSPVTIIMVERYDHFPRYETREKIAQALEVDMQAIWPSVEQSNPLTAA